MPTAQDHQGGTSSLRALGEIILDDEIDDVALRPKLFAAVPRDKLQEQVAGLHDWVSGKRSDAFHGIVRRFSHFRQFSPTMLSALEFFPDAGQTSSPCVKAIQVLRKMNIEQHGHKKVMLPDDAPVDFIPKRLATVVIKDRALSVSEGHQGRADLRVVADAQTWIRFLNHEVSILRCLITRKIPLKGPPRLLRDFGQCFPT